MKICTKCNRALSDEETTCPYCSSEQLADGGSESDALMSAVLYDSATIELSAGDIEAALEAVDTELSDNYDFPEPPDEPEEGDAPEASEPQPEPQPEPRQGEPEAVDVEPEPRRGFIESGGELEARVKDIVKAEGAREESGAPRKLGVTLIAVLIVAVLAFTVLCLVKYMKAPVESDSQMILDYISGRWLSEPFVFADDLSHGYVEILEITPDGAFTITHLIPDPRNENGYKDGSWETDYRFSGVVEIFPDDKCVLFKYSEFGKGYYIDRYIAKMELDSLALREYYDEQMSESYDIVYKRIGDAQAAPDGEEQAAAQTSAQLS